MKIVGTFLYYYGKLPTHIKVTYFISFALCSLASMQMPRPFSDILPISFAVLTVLVLVDLFFKD